MDCLYELLEMYIIGIIDGAVSYRAIVLLLSAFFMALFRLHYLF
jgi:hypothetical protein